MSTSLQLTPTVAAQQLHGAFRAFLVYGSTQRSLPASVSGLNPEISAWKSSFCPGRPRVHWALPNRDCVTAGNFWFCFVHRSRRITSSETHLTRLHLLGCPLLNPYSGLHLPARWEIQRCRDSGSDYTEAAQRTHRQWEKDRDLLHFTLTLSSVADVDPYGLIFRVLHVLNLHIYYKLDIWATLSAVHKRLYLCMVSAQTQTLCSGCLSRAMLRFNQTIAPTEL